MAERTGRTVQKNLGGGGNNGANGATRALGSGFRSAAAEAERSAREVDRSLAKQIKSAERAANAEKRAARKLTDDKLKFLAEVESAQDKSLKKQTRNAEREADKQAATAKRTADKVENEHKQFARRVSQRTVRFLFPNPIGAFGMASRIGGDLLRGAGVDTSISSLVQRSVGIESASVALSNRGHIEGDKDNGQVVASAELAKEARSAGIATAVNPEDILKAGHAFVGITGDLKTWRGLMPGLVKQTAALGGNQEDAAKMAAEYSAHLGDIPDKVNAVLRLVAVSAGQGKIGGMDSSDFAKYAAKAAAPAAQFEGDKAQNIGRLTAIAEIAKMHGGAANPAIAFTGIQSFVSTLKKPARLKSISKLIGKEDGQFTDSSHSLLRNVNDIIKDIIVGAATDKRTGKVGLASLTKAGAAVGDSRAMMAVTGSLNTFNEAGGGAKGLAAVTAELEKFDGAIMSSTEVERANAEQLKTSRAQAEIFNQSLEAITQGAMAELGPALKSLQGPALQAAQGLAWMVKEAAAHPIQAAGIAVAGALARSLGEATFRSVIEKSIMNAMASGNGLQIGGAGLLITIAAATVAMHLIDEDIKDREDDQRKDAIANGHAGELEAKAYTEAKSGTITESSKDDLTAIDANLEERLGRVKKLKNNEYGAYDPNASEAMLGAESILNPTKFAARQDASHLDELKQELADNKRILDMIRTGNLNVTVTNANEIGANSGPQVFAPGRQLGPGHLPDYLRR